MSGQWTVYRSEMGGICCVEGPANEETGEIEFADELDAVRHAIACNEDIRQSVRGELRSQRRRLRALSKAKHRQLKVSQ